ncbi:hypothetical protein ABEY43_07220 [Priestia megaterium]
MKELKESMSLEKLYKARYELDIAIQLVESGQLRESKKHIDENKDQSIGAIHLINAELEGGE